MHQHAEDGFPHLGSVIIQAYNSVEVKSLRLISEAAYPLLAFFPVSSPTFTVWLRCNKANVCTCVYMLQLHFSTSAEMKKVPEALQDLAHSCALL